MLELPVLEPRVLESSPNAVLESRTVLEYIDTLAKSELQKVIQPTRPCCRETLMFLKMRHEQS